jgi:hypothetical protein
MLLPKLRKLGRIKEKYSPTPNSVEKRHEGRLREMPCIGCGAYGVDLHHTMLRVPGKRWRRDHRFQIPVCPECHQGTNGIHGIGNEQTWADRMGLDTAAIAYQLWMRSEELDR